MITATIVDIAISKVRNNVTLGAIITVRVSTIACPLISDQLISIPTAALERAHCVGTDVTIQSPLLIFALVEIWKSLKQTQEARPLPTLLYPFHNTNTIPAVLTDGGRDIRQAVV